jgi:putative CocE/NonD family hydrolase
MNYKAMAILLLSLFIFCNADSQQIYFPKGVLKDSVALSEYMPIMAKQIVNHLNATPKDKRDGEYYNSAYALQQLAGFYKESNVSIDSLRSIIYQLGGLSKNDASGYLNIYEIYNLTKIKQRAGLPAPEPDIFKQLLFQSLEKFKGTAYLYATEPYSSTIASLETEWRKSLQKVQKIQADSLAIDSAIAFSQAYLQYVVYKKFFKIGKQVLVDVDKADYIVRDSVMIPVRDGVKLAAVIVRNRKITTPQPVVMIGSIYASQQEVHTAKDIVDHGFTGIILNIRGKYNSKTAIVPLEHDADDIYDAIEWIAQQKWCNGKLGMYGGSYSGFTQWAAAKKLPPALKTIVPQAAAAPGIDFPIRNGIYSTFGLRWIHSIYNNRLTDWKEFYDGDYWNTVFNKWYKSGKPFDKLDSLDGRPNPIFKTWLKHPSYDEYWQKMIPYKQEFSKINIPVLTITGYFDTDQQGALYYYTEHLLYNSNANHYLVIGPYDHGGSQGGTTSVVNGYAVDEAAKIDISSLVFEWFDFILKGGPKPDLLKDKFNYQIMGANKWGHSTSLKTSSNDFIKFYLSDVKDGAHYMLSSNKQDHTVNQKIDFTSRETQKISDTYNLVSDSLGTDGGVDFVSDALDKDITIAGSFTAALFASINKKDMDIDVSIIEARPDGKYMPLSATLQRASYAQDRSKRKLLTPGKKEFIPLTGSFISKKIVKGSKLILHISGMTSPIQQINYGTGRDVSTEAIEDGKEPLQVEWFGDSFIQIPVVR